MLVMTNQKRSTGSTTCQSGLTYFNRILSKHPRGNKFLFGDKVFSNPTLGDEGGEEGE